MEYGFYLARIVGTAKSKDSRLTVKILPQMEGISDIDCPVWPSFFKDSLYTGKKGDLVWVICDDEFSLGYVFGLANYNTYSEVTDAESNAFEKTVDGVALSLPADLIQAISEASVSIDAVHLNLNNAKVTYWDDDCIHYIERDSGGKVIAFRAGTLYIFRKDEFLVKIGTNVIKMDASGIGLTGGRVLLQSDYIGLGNGKCNGNVLVTRGTDGSGAYAAEAVHA